MLISICQINPIVGDFRYNSSLMLNAVERSKAEGCSLAVFPELSLLGYPPKDLLEKPAFISDNLKYLESLSSGIKDIHILCGYVENNPEKKGKRLINSVALLKDGDILGRGGKILLPSYDVFDETRYFEPAKESLLFELDRIRIGVTICEDIWNVGDIEDIPGYGRDPVSELSTRGMDVLINISASPYTIEKSNLRLAVLKKTSQKYNIPAIYCNQVGGNDDILFDGSSMVLDHHGKLVVQAEEFKPDMIIYDTVRAYKEIESRRADEEESILKGLVMGIRDYAHKCGFVKVLLGLSGGIDSSLVAAIAQRAMGPENVLGISMPSPYTSAMSKDCAKKLAKNLNIRFREVPIDKIFDSYRTALTPTFKGMEEDATEENIQARIRGNILMAMSNKFNLLLLSTGNKSETATGYCTLYGDMSGGLAVISDMPKTLCYRLARYINRDGEIIPKEVLSRPPSAELRYDQTDQDSLPPYDVLDKIVEAIVEKNLSFEDIVSMGHPTDIVKDVFKRIVNNEYKRRQAPPGLKITSKAFGYGRRYPIARGGEYY